MRVVQAWFKPLRGSRNLPAKTAATLDSNVGKPVSLRCELKRQGLPGHRSGGPFLLRSISMLSLIGTCGKSGSGSESERCRPHARPNQRGSHPPAEPGKIKVDPPPPGVGTATINRVVQTIPAMLPKLTPRLRPFSFPGSLFKLSKHLRKLRLNVRCEGFVLDKDTSPRRRRMDFCEATAVLRLQLLNR